MLSSKPFWTIFSYYVLNAVLVKLNYKIADLSTFCVKFILSEDKGAIVGSPTFVFETLWVERAHGVHY